MEVIIGKWNCNEDYKEWDVGNIIYNHASRTLHFEVMHIFWLFSEADVIGGEKY